MRFYHPHMGEATPKEPTREEQLGAAVVTTVLQCSARFMDNCLSKSTQPIIDYELDLPDGEHASLEISRITVKKLRDLSASAARLDWNLTTTRYSWSLGVAGNSSLKQLRNECNDLFAVLEEHEVLVCSDSVFTRRNKSEGKLIMDRELLRHLLFTYLKSNQKTQLTTIYSGVATLAVDGGHVPQSSNCVPGAEHYSVDILPESDRLVLQELTWELIIQGILAPGSNLSNPNLPFVRLTEYGKRCLAECTILPHDYGTYLQAIEEVASSTDPTFLLYLKESVGAFNKTLYISCVVNLGIASEQLTLLLIEAFKDALRSPAHRTKFEQGVNKQRHI